VDEEEKMPQASKLRVRVALDCNATFGLVIVTVVVVVVVVCLARR